MYTVLNEDFIIAGDINIHVETDDAPSRKFHEIIDIFDLKQHVCGPTHIKGHTIDVIITRNNKSAVHNVVITKYNLSHHFLIDFVFNAEITEATTKTITYRNVKKVDCKRFCNDIVDQYSKLPCTTDMTEKITGYNTVMTTVMNKHAPIITKTIRLVPHAPWFDAEYASLRRQRRKAENMFRKTGNQADEAEYNRLRTQTTSLAQSKKKSYINDKLSTNISSKNLYAIVNNLLDNNQEPALPSSTSDITLANNFKTYFSDKVNKICASITQSVVPTIQTTPADKISLLHEFEPATAAELKQITTSFKVKCSPEDPIPAFLLKENIDIFIPYWLEIVNLSLELGSMDCLKSAVILPLIKDLGSLVDKDNYKNYRPFSNVLLLKILNNLLISCDDNMPSVVLLLDLSAAFDTVDHNKLLEILFNDIGIRGKAYSWCKSFLINRTFKVKIGNAYSDVEMLLF